MPLEAASRSDLSRETGVLVEEAVISRKDLLSITLLPNLNCLNFQSNDSNLINLSFY